MKEKRIWKCQERKQPPLLSDGRGCSGTTYTVYSLTQDTRFMDYTNMDCIDLLIMVFHLAVTWLHYITLHVMSFS